jgi:hypothetical protein
MGSSQPGVPLLLRNPACFGAEAVIDEIHMVAALFQVLDGIAEAVAPLYGKLYSSI